MDGRELLKAYGRFKDEAQLYRGRACHLEDELREVRPQLYRARQRIDRLEQRCGVLRAENRILKQRIADLTSRLKHKPKPAAPAFAKANVPEKPRRKKPGRRPGHAAALRPL